MVTVRHCLQPSFGRQRRALGLFIAECAGGVDSTQLSEALGRLPCATRRITRAIFSQQIGRCFWPHYLGEICRGAISDRQITVIAMSTHNVRSERSLVAEDARANVTLVGLLLRRRLFVQRIKV